MGSEIFAIIEQREREREKRDNANFLKRCPKSAEAMVQRYGETEIIKAQVARSKLSRR